MKLLIVCAIFLVALFPITQAQVISSTSFCSTGVACCVAYSNCMAAIAANFEFEALSTSAPLNTFCFPPTCPLGHTLSGVLCVRDDTSITPSSLPMYNDLSDCLLSASTYGPHSYQIRHCMEGLMQVKRQCLFNLGLKA